MVGVMYMCSMDHEVHCNFCSVGRKQWVLVHLDYFVQKSSDHLGLGHEQ